MARHRRLAFLLLLAALTLNGSAAGSGIGGFRRATVDIRAARASASSSSHDAVLPYQQHPDLAAAGRRTERERGDRRVSVAILGCDAGNAVAFTNACAADTSSREAPTLTTGSRAPPIVSAPSLH